MAGGDDAVQFAGSGRDDAVVVDENCVLADRIAADEFYVSITKEAVLAPATMVDTVSAGLFQGRHVGD